MDGSVTDNVQWRSFPLLSVWGMFMISGEVTDDCNDEEKSYLDLFLPKQSGSF
jgi:hypothetical protein